MRRTKFRQLAFAILLITGIQVAQADGRFHPPFEVTGSVMKNHDGDTIKLVTDARGVITIRLSGADTPETGQAYWKTARNYLRSLVAGQKTTAWCYKQDRFDREVCHVRVGNQDIGQALIAAGYAWYAFQFAAELTDEQRLAYPEAERRASARRSGLWQQVDPMPPWECRRLIRAKKREFCR